MAARADERLERFRAELLPRLVERFRPERVIAFGSRVRGDALASSDLDLIVVAESFRDVRWVDRPLRILEALDPPFAIDVLCYTPEEYARKRQELGIVRTATAEGTALYADGRSAA